MLVVIEAHAKFADCAQRARELAAEVQEPVTFVSCRGAWTILGSEWARACAKTKKWGAREQEPKSTFNENENERQLLIEELAADQDSWALSDDVGWYYDD